jgi:enoyl ACP reductase
VPEHADGLDGVVHGIAFAPAAAMGGRFLAAEWPDVATAVHVSACSLKALAMAALPLMTGGGAVAGMDFGAAVAWPACDWTGVARAALESTADSYLARELGPRGARVSLMAASRNDARNVVPSAWLTSARQESLSRLLAGALRLRRSGGLAIPGA